MSYIAKDAKALQAEQLLLDALRRFEPRVMRAFLAAARLIESQVVLDRIIAALQAGDLAAAARAAGAEALGPSLRGVGLPPETRTALAELTAAFEAGGVAGALMLPREASLAASLDLTNPEAVRYLREHIPELIRDISATSRASVQEALLHGMDSGRPIDIIARDIRGAVPLTPQWARAVDNFRTQLETGEMGAGAAPWDRRLSATERAQARSIFYAGGERSARVNTLVDRYRQRLINRRALNIARTETHRAFINGQDELWRQAADQSLIDVTTTRRIWIVTHDDRLRASHRAIPGMNEEGVPLNGAFATPFGPVHSPADGVPDLINCRCSIALRFVP